MAESLTSQATRASSSYFGDDVLLTTNIFESSDNDLNQETPKFKLGQPAAIQPAPFAENASFQSNFNLRDEESFVVLSTNSIGYNAASLADYEEIQQKSMSINYNSILSTLSHEEIEKKVSELLQENTKLRETLVQNNARMKQQFNTLAVWQDELRKVHGNHKQKFAETRDIMTSLMRENADLKAKFSMQTSAKSFDFWRVEDTISEIQQHAIDYPSLKPEELQLIEQQNELLSQEITKSSLKKNEVDSVPPKFQDDSLEKLIDETKRQESDIPYLQGLIDSLKQQIHILSENTFTSGLLNLEKPPDKVLDENRLKFLENFTHYNEKLAALIQCYAAQTARYINIQNCLKRSIDSLKSCENIRELKVDGRIEATQKILDESRMELIQEQLKNVAERKNLIEAHNQFQNIFSNYSTVLYQLEISQEENLKVSEKNISIENEKLELEKEKKMIEEAKIELEKEKKIIAAEREMLNLSNQSLEGEKACLNSQSRLYEAEMKSLQDDNKLLQKRHDDMLAETTKLKEEILMKDTKIDDQTETIGVLRAHVEQYKCDFDEESTSRQSLLREREQYVEELGKLSKTNQELLFKLNGQNGREAGDFCESCGLYKSAGQWHGPGFCHPID